MGEIGTIYLRRRISLRKIIFVVFLTVSLVGYFFLFLYTENEKKTNTVEICKIPHLNPYEKSAIKLIKEQTQRKHPTPPQCEVNPTAQFRTDGDTHLIHISKIDTNDQDWRNNLTNDSLFEGNCCYKPFTTTGSKYELKFSPECIQIHQVVTKIPLGYENIQVLCKDSNDKLIYRDYFHFFRLNEPIEKALQEKEDKSRATGRDFLSIIFLGIDSVAFTNFQRFLPKTRNYLVQNMSAVEFIGLNKVGRGTMENLVPTLSGCSYYNGRTIFPTESEECYLIWEKYTQQGYRTVLSEEQFWLLIYQYMKRNAKGKHNMTYENLPFIRGIQSTCTYALGRYGCFEHQLAARVLTDRILQVARKLKGKLYYHHLWSALTSHDVLEFAKYLDNPFHELLTNLTSQNLLNNTVLILNSDHGTVTSEYSRTAEGLIEARVPLLYFVFPDWFESKYKIAMMNLKKNSKGLTSPYDLYQTLNDLVNLDSITDNVLTRRYSSMSQSDQDQTKPEWIKGQSLFLPIPLNRTCEDAGIPDEYCICYSWKQLDDPTRDVRIVKAVSYCLDQMNKRLSSYSKCNHLDLGKIIHGRMSTKNNGEIIYEVTFETVPGNGIFGAVVKVDIDTTRKGFGGTMKYSLVGEIERQNLYGKQSDCLSITMRLAGWIRSACYCR